ncbi:hypothetical protein TNCV_3271411 [Trichonephila clavipes]|nr:hypothetical protein TNCV_3271411 [Trichonephila clavipes]
MRICNQWVAEGPTERHAGFPRPPMTNAQENRHIVRVVQVFCAEYSDNRKRVWRLRRDLSPTAWIYIEHSKPPSYIQSTLLPSGRALTTVLPHAFSWRSLSRNAGEYIPGNPSPPTFSGSNTIRSWSPTSSTDAEATFASNSSFL